MKLILGIFLSMAFIYGSHAENLGERGACKEDIQKYCGEMKRGGGRIAKCLKENESKLSDACKKLQAMRKEHRSEKRKSIKEVCEADRNKLCAKKGFRCLKDHKDKLSAECRKAMDEIQK